MGKAVVNCSDNGWNPVDVPCPRSSRTQGNRWSCDCQVCWCQGGRGYFIARNFRDFRRNVDLEEEFTIQEYVLGTRYYFQFFFDPIAEDGYQVEGMGSREGTEVGRLELMSIDRRDEANVDEFYKLGSLRDIRDMGLEPSFVVTGNTPAVLRESLLPEAFRMGRELWPLHWSWRKVLE